MYIECVYIIVINNKVRLFFMNMKIFFIVVVVVLVIVYFFFVFVVQKDIIVIVNIDSIFELLQVDGLFFLLIMKLDFMLGKGLVYKLFQICFYSNDQIKLVNVKLLNVL